VQCTFLGSKNTNTPRFLMTEKQHKCQPEMRILYTPPHSFLMPYGALTTTDLLVI
jgi:hypothetical protein